MNKVTISITTTPKNQKKSDFLITKGLTKYSNITKYILNQIFKILQFFLDRIDKKNEGVLFLDLL